MEFIDIQRRLVDVILRLPVASSFGGRTSLLQGLPPNVALQRSQGLARLDLNNIVSGLNDLGRLTRQGGVRPLIVVLDNAAEYVPDGSELGAELQDVRAMLEAHYGGDLQPTAEERISKATLEALIFGPQRDARVSFAFVEQAYTISRSVARFATPRVIDGKPDGNVMYGTAWIIAPRVLITNHHVVDARDYRPKPFGAGETFASPTDFEAQAQRAVADFGYFSERAAGQLQCRVSRLLAASRELDYAIVEVDGAGAEAIADREPIPLASAAAMTRGSRLNVAQHPNGGPLRFAIRNNFFVRPDGDTPFLFYQTDTEPGASGAPVCNDEWQAVALHHASWDVPPEEVPQEVLDGAPAKVKILNRAVRIQDVLGHLQPDLRERILAAQ